MTYKKKLIEVALPLAKINFESAREKSIRHGHPSTLHLWWARRPLAAARAVLWSSLVDDPSSHPEKFPTEEEQAVERRRLFDILERLMPWESTLDERVLAEARAEILKSCDDEMPKVLDPFAGGGTIPLEALRLGLPSFAGDLNPVAVLIQRAMLEIPSIFAGRPPAFLGLASTRSVWSGAEGLAADVQAYGKWMQSEALKRIGSFYPDVTLPDGKKATPIAWIWARTVKSPDPSWPGHVPLVKTWELVRKPGKPIIWVEPLVDQVHKKISYMIRTDGNPPEGNVTRSGAVCIATGTSIPLSYIKDEGMHGRLGQELIAVVAEGERGRIYEAPTAEHSVLNIPDSGWYPSGAMSDHPQYMGTVRYGMDEWHKLFAPRQLLALTTFSDLLEELRAKVIGDLPSDSGEDKRLRDKGNSTEAYADALVTYLAFAIDKCADYWSSVCTWNAAGEKIRNTFGRQAIPMAWDYAETNPFSSSTGNWMAMVDWVARVLARTPTNSSGQTAQRDARSRIVEVGKCVISTDPPYYDNVPYSDLSDFFYVWLRRNLKTVWPDECATLLAPKVEELVANARRHGSKEEARVHFELGMEGVFGEAANYADERFPTTIFYAFKATESEEEGNVSNGWEIFLSGLLSNGWVVTATWPMRTELGNRMRSIGANALATSVVLACRKRENSASMATRGEFISALRSEMAAAIKILQVENIAPVDMAQSAIGPGIGIFSRYSKVVEADGQSMTIRTALALINEVLAEVLSGEESEFDADTRFAVTWFEQFGHNPGAFGDADTLAKAKNTTVVGVCDSGIAISREGRLRLVERNELPSSWDPSRDSRLTVWETTQHLIRAVEQSESEAAELLKKIGSGFGEKARQLAYLLYGICDRKKWASEAGAYNMLVTAWPEIEKLSRQEMQFEPTPDTLF